MSWDLTITGVEAPDAEAARSVARQEVARLGYTIRTLKRVIHTGHGRWTVVYALADSPDLPTVTVIPSRSDA